MRTVSLILSVALLAVSSGVPAQTPEDGGRLPILPEPSFPEDAKPSLITGHLATANPIGALPCPRGAICLDAVWNDTFEDMQTQLGPAIDPKAHVRSVHDSGLAGRPVVAYVVKPDKDGQLWAIALRAVYNRGACFDSSLADSWPELASDHRTKRSKREVCFRLK